MSKQNRDVELVRLMQEKALDLRNSTVPYQGIADQLPNVPMAPSRIPILISRKQKAGVVNPSFVKEEASISRNLGNVAAGFAGLLVCVMSCFLLFCFWMFLFLACTFSIHKERVSL